MDEIKTKVRNYLGRSLKDKNFSDSEDLFNLGLLDSLFATRLLVFIEKTFGFELDSEDLDLQKIRTVNAIIKLIETKLSAIK